MGDSTEIDSCSLPAALLDGVLGRNKSRLVPSGVGFARLSGAIPRAVLVDDRLQGRDDALQGAPGNVVWDTILVSHADRYHQHRDHLRLAVLGFDPLTS